MTDKHYLYPIRNSRSSLNYRKKGQLAQLVRESDLFFRVKWQIKTVLTNVVVEHVKSRMSTVISGRLPVGNVLIFLQTVAGAGYRKVRVK